MNDKKKLILGIILFGSLWGGLEALGISVMNSLNFSFKSPFLAVVGILILGIARVLFPKIGTTFLIGLLAGIFKYFTLPQLFFCQIEAVIIQGLVLETAFSFAQKKKLSSWFSLGLVALVSMYVNYFVFALLQTYVFFNSYWVEQGFPKVLSYTLGEGSLASFLSFFFISLSFAIGRFFVPAFEKWQSFKAKAYGLTTILVSCGCWVLGFLLYR